MMESVRIESPGFEFPENDIWDRVKSLAPTSPPVAVRLFSRPPSPHMERAAKRSGIEWTPAHIRAIPPESEARATANWAGIPIASTGLRETRQDAIGIDLDRNSPVSQSFDQLRARLLQALRTNGWRRVAIVAPTPGCGATFTACNLAVSLSRLVSCRTVLIDLNLKSPGVAKSFGLARDTEMRRFLTGELSLQSGLMRYSGNLAIGAGGQAEAASAELLHDARTADALQKLEDMLNPEVMLFDLPPILAYDDLSVFLPRVDGVLLVADGTGTTAKQIAECERAISGQTNLLGVILNKSRDTACTELGYGHG